MRLEEQEFSERSKVKNLGFFIKLKCVFQKKLFDFLKIAKRSKFARECDWIGKILKKF